MTKPWHILTEHANGVSDQKGKFYPFQSKTNPASGNLWTGQPGIRIYIKSAFLGLASTESLAAGLATITACWSGKAAQTFIGLITPATPAATVSHAGINHNIGILTDAATDIVLTVTTSTGRGGIVYAEIDEAEGEYST